MSAEELLALRFEEPDWFHFLVKMHLAFLLDLNTDDCDCAFVYEDCAAAAAAANKDHQQSFARRILNTPKKLRAVPGQSSSSSSSGVMHGAALTMEGVCQVFQLVEYLGRERNLTTEGVFRKHGNLRKQTALKERLNRGVPIDLDEGEFSVHECAAVLKSFLAELSEPLLTDACYRAHCQAAQLVKEEGDTTEKERSEAEAKRTECLQLLFLLIPEPNYNLLRDLLFLLHRVAQQEKLNKMGTANLGTMFAPLILCPRKISAESIQTNHQMLSRAVAAMIADAEVLFKLPQKLRTDLEMHLKDRAKQPKTPSRKTLQVDADGRVQSPVVKTMISFVDREKTNQAAAESSTDSELAALYAHVQSWPESERKRKLIAKLNDANGQGTPQVTGSTRKKKRDGGGGRLRGLLTPKRGGGSSKVTAGTTSSTSTQKDAPDQAKIGRRHASYSLQQQGHFATPSQVLHSFRRQKSESASSSDDHQQKSEPIDQKLLSPQSSPAILVSPSAIEAITSKTATLQKEEDLDGSYIVAEKLKETETSEAQKKKKSLPPPPVPERISSLNKASKEISPITSCAQKMPSEMQQSMFTPRSRRPVLAASSLAHLAAKTTSSNGFLPPESPSLPPEYNEDEPDEEVVVTKKEEEEATQKHSETPSSLKKEFKEYLTSQQMALESSPASSSVLEASVTSSVIGKEAEMLLSGEMALSESMCAVLDGNLPDDDEKERSVGEGPVEAVATIKVQPEENSASCPVTPSMLDPVDVDSVLALSDITEEEDDRDNDDEDDDKENSSVLSASYISAKSNVSATYSTASTTICQDIPLPASCEGKKEVATCGITISYPNDGGGNVSGSVCLTSGEKRKQGRKRRSLTEISDLNPVTQQRRGSKNIFFETDV